MNRPFRLAVNRFLREVVIGTKQVCVFGNVLHYVSCFLGSHMVIALSPVSPRTNISCSTLSLAMET